MQLGSGQGQEGDRAALLSAVLVYHQASRWTYSSDTALSPDRKIRANVVQRYHFSSNLRRMTATVEVSWLFQFCCTLLAALLLCTSAVAVDYVPGGPGGGVWHAAAYGT